MGFKAVAIEETSHFQIEKEDLPYIEKITSIYFYQEGVATYLCSFQPMSLLHYAYTSAWCKVGTPDDVRERINERYELCGGDDDYFDFHDIKSLPDQYDLGELDEDQTVEDLREFLMGNCVL